MENALTEAVVDLSAVAHNTAVLAAAAYPAQLMAVVKADGFGHGASRIASTALKRGASWIGVTSAAEALKLRDQGITAPMLIWMFTPGADLLPVMRAGVDLSVGSVAQLAIIAETAERSGLVAQVHLKIDTGLSRGGAAPDEWADLLVMARKHEESGALQVRGLWSHLAHAEDLQAPSLEAQIRRFDAAVSAAESVGLDPMFRHLANSAATLQAPMTHMDLCRCGAALYGIDPIPDRKFGLRPAMTLQARLILTKQVRIGTKVSYGHDWVSDRATTLALVPLGYADGIPSRCWDRASVWINGRRCPIAGRITMDQFVIDVGDLPVAAGDRVVVFGPGDLGEPTVADWARWADTNPHEILTGIGSRVPRRYLPEQKSNPLLQTLSLQDAASSRQGEQR